MKSYELLIHYAANNMVSEDARWKRIAHGIANFKPKKKVRLSETIVDTSNLQPECHPLATSTQPLLISSELQRPIQLSSSDISLTDTNQNLHSTQRKRKANTILEDRTHESSKRTKRTSFARTKQGLNPGFKRPIVTYLKTGKTGQAQITPRSESVCKPTVLVPFSEDVKHRRTLSKTTGAEESVRSCDTNDQFTSSYVDETSFVDDSPDHVSPLEPRSVSELGVSIDHNEYEIHRYPGNQEQSRPSTSPFQRQNTGEEDGSATAMDDDLAEDELNMGTRTTPSAQYIISSEDRESLQSERDITTPSVATETPSDAARYLDDTSPLAEKARETHPAIIDLTSQTERSPLRPTRRDVLGVVSSPLRDRERSGSKPVPHTELALTQISALPRRVMCRPRHTAKSRPFVSFLPRCLIDLADRFGLIDLFRPIIAPASIRNSDRGYWSLRIKVTNAIAVARARRPPLTASQWSDKRFMLRQEGFVGEGEDTWRELMYPNLDPTVYTPWTSQEFTEFWEYLAKVVDRGQAGYDVRATFKCKRQDPGEVYLDVNVFGYAETLSHIWLVLYGVSSNLTASMPLQWHVPGTGPLITMSGQPRYGGKIGRWVPKDDGAEGSWGLEEDWEGLVSTSGAMSHNP